MKKMTSKYTPRPNFFINIFIVLTLTNGGMSQMPQPDRSLMETKLKRAGISSSVISKMAAGNGNVFQTMDLSDFQKLTPDLIADVGTAAIENLNIDQIKMMSKMLYQGNEAHLDKIFGVLNKQQLNGVLDAIKETYGNSSEFQHLNCVQFEPLIKAMKRTSGEANTWTKDTFDKLGSDFIQCLPPKDLQNVAGNKNVFRSLLNNIKNSGDKHKTVPPVEKRSLLESATTAFGAMKDWTLEDVKSASSLVVMLKPKDLKELDTAVVKDAIQDLGMELWEEKRGKEVVAKLKDPSKGFGAVSSWTADVVEKLGNLRGSLSKKELTEISNEVLRESVRAFGQTELPPYKKRVLSTRVKGLYGQVKNWTAGHIQNASELLGGIDVGELEEIDADALLGALPSVKDIKLPRHKGRVLAKKIQNKIGDVQQWNVTVVKQIGPLVKDLPETMLKLLQPDEAREAVKMLRTRVDVPMSKKRLLIKQALAQGGSTSRLSVREFGEFVSEFPLTELKKIVSVVDILPDLAAASNESTEAEAMWKPSQARNLLEYLVMDVDNWGPVTENNENWAIGNIKKLGRLGLGLRKSDLANLSSTSFPDFAAEFSRITNWTIGQAKKISSRFMEAFKERESEVTITEIKSLGDFVINIVDPVLRRLSQETSREAVRLMGASRLYGRLPKILKQTKTKLALDILDKGFSSLTGDELEDVGNLIGGFEKDDVAEIDSNAFTDAVVALGDVQGLDAEITKALALKAIDAYGGASSFNGEILHDLGHIVEGLESSDIASIPDAVIDDNLHVFAEANLDANVAKAVLDKAEASKRKRRAVVMSSKTGDELIEMGSTLLALTKDEILAVTNAAFTSAVAEISSIKGFTSEQLQAWASKAKSAWGSPSTFTEDEVLQLNEFAKGFTADELKVIPISSNEVLENLGSLSGYSQSQISKLWENVKTAKNPSTMTSDDLQSLGVIALGLTGTEIGQISTGAYEDAALELGMLEGWSSDQTKSLKNKAVATFGAVTSWSAPQMSLVGAAIGGFTAAEIQSIDADELDAVQPSALKQIPAEIFKEFSTEQLSELSAEQAAAVTTAQRAVLSSEQKDTLMKVETDTLEYSSGCYPISWSGHLFASAIIIQFSLWLS